MAKMLGMAYRNILKPVFFRFDPEQVHDRMIGFGAMLGRRYATQRIVRGMFHYANPVLRQDILGIKFPNPIGLAAGFDKNAELTDIIPAVGFGFMEVGSITGEPCEGNPKPRLWRLPNSRALVVYYGLKNDGAEQIAARLRGKKFSIPVGISVAKTNSPATVKTEKGIKDYCKAYAAFADIGQYTTVNISCPNAFGGEPFTDPERLDLLLQSLRNIPSKKPVFLKLAPDLSEEQLDGILKTARRHRIDGLICTNLTKRRDLSSIKDACPAQGGISGKVVEPSADLLLERIYSRTQKFVLIGCGGVFTAVDAYRKIRLGASLIQMITGMIFQGPQVIGEINEGLVRLLKADGYRNIAEAVGQ